MVSSERGATFADAAEWYDYASAEHFWFQWRLAAMKRLFVDLGLPLDRPLRVLDVGCGTGVLRTQLESTTAWTVDAADLNLGALRAVPPGRGSILYYDIEERRDPYVDSYDVVTLCDVIEHIEHVRPFLDAVTRHLKPQGLLVVNVPALPALFGSYDEAAGHLRRYTADSLAAECRSIDLEISETRYWGLCMVPLLWIRKLWVKPAARDTSVLEEGFVPPANWVHAVLRGMMRLETGILRRPIIGSSVLLAARRPTARGDRTAVLR